MKKKVIAYVILALIVLFPFRWAFLDYPNNVKVNNTYIDGGRIEYVVYFLMVIFGFLAFMLMTMTEGEGHKHNEAH
jgi:hypothetical protein